MSTVSLQIARRKAVWGPKRTGPFLNTFHSLLEWMAMRFAPRPLPRMAEAVALRAYRAEWPNHRWHSDR